MTIYNVVMIKVSIDSDFVDPVCLLVLMAVMCCFLSTVDWGRNTIG